MGAPTRPPLSQGASKFATNARRGRVARHGNHNMLLLINLRVIVQFVTPALRDHATTISALSRHHGITREPRQWGRLEPYGCWMLPNQMKPALPPSSSGTLYPAPLAQDAPDVGKVWVQPLWRTSQTV